MNPKISVIIPIFGTEKFLDKCIKSVTSQTFKDIEIICVDDCSPDKSYKIVEEYIAKDSRVSLIRHEKNLGLGGARNTGIRAAKADYIASVDSDDYMSKEMLETLWNATEDGWFDIVCCGYSRVDENGNILSNVKYDEEQVSNDDNSIDIFSTLNPAFWNKLWRKSLYVDNDIFFPEHDFYEDMSTTPRVLAKSSYVKVINNCLYRYLIREQSIMNGMSDKHIIDYIKGFEIISRFLEENDLSEHYSKEFYHYIRGNFIFYSKSILNSGLIIDKKSQYLRFLVLFRITFTENFKKYNCFDINGLLSSLNEEELHGAYFDKFQQALRQIDVKENYISRQLLDIDKQKQLIGSYESTINQLRDEKNTAKSELNKTKAVLSNTQTVLTKSKTDFSNLNINYDSVSNSLKRAKEDLSIAKEDLSIKQERVAVLEEVAAEKVSFAQMFAVFFFAILTAVVMSKKQTLKLINKPKMFFRDSKSGFAKKYASWFNIV